MGEVVGGVVKVIELVGSSGQSFSDAVRNAGRSLHNLKGVEVLSTTAEIEGNELINYKAHCKTAFVVDGNGSDGEGEAEAAAAAVGAMSAPNHRRRAEGTDLGPIVLQHEPLGVAGLLGKAATQSIVWLLGSGLARCVSAGGGTSP